MHYKLQKVPTVSLSTLLRDLDQVDLIDSDVQGAEADVFEAAAEAVDRKVSRVFIETHGLPLEERLRLCSRAWTGAVSTATAPTRRTRRLTVRSISEAAY